MTRKLPVTLLVLLALASCGTIRDSRVNPFNWFSSGQDVPEDARSDGDTALFDATALSDTTLIASIKNVSVAAVPGGIILTATGVAAAQQFHSAELIKVPNDDPSILTFGFQALPPLGPVRIGTETSREIMVATRLTRQDMAGVRILRVIADQNAREVRR